MRRSLLAFLFVLMLAPAAQAHFTASPLQPTEPIPLDGTKTVVFQLELECSHVILRPGTEPLTMAFTVDQGGLNLTGPSGSKIDRTTCLNPQDIWKQDELYTIFGDPFLPGLVPINVTFTGTLEASQVGDAVDPVAAATATATITPIAIIDYYGLDFGQVTPTAGGAVANTTIVNAGNVDLNLVVTPATADGPSAGVLRVTQAGGLLSRATSALNFSTSPLVLEYEAPKNGTGVDRYELSIQPTVVLDPTIKLEPVILHVEFPYKTVTGDDGTETVSVQVNAEFENPSTSSSTSNGSPAVEMVALTVAFVVAAFVRRKT